MDSNGQTFLKLSMHGVAVLVLLLPLLGGCLDRGGGHGDTGIASVEGSSTTLAKLQRCEKEIFRIFVDRSSAQQLVPEELTPSPFVNPSLVEAHFDVFDCAGIDLAGESRPARLLVFWLPVRRNDDLSGAMRFLHYMVEVVVDEETPHLAKAMKGVGIDVLPGNILLDSRGATIEAGALRYSILDDPLTSELVSTTLEDNSTRFVQKTAGAWAWIDADSPLRGDSADHGPGTISFEGGSAAALTVGGIRPGTFPGEQFRGEASPDWVLGSSTDPVPPGERPIG